MTSIQKKHISSHRWMALWSGLNDEPYIAHPENTAIEGVIILAIDEQENILFVREPRGYDGEWILSLPAGGVEHGEDPLIAGNPELQEEIGYKGNQMKLLGTFNPLARHAYWDIHAILATDLNESKLPNPDTYDITSTLTRIPRTQFRDLIKQGEIQDSTIISALYLAEDELYRGL